MDTWITVLALVAAGAAAGAINGVVGSGSLITFSTLLAVGVPPVAANGTNTTGLFPGSFASAYAYRRELRDRLRTLRFPIIATTVGAAIGALFQTAGLSPLLDLKTIRRVERRANQEVWGETV